MLAGPPASVRPSVRPSDRPSVRPSVRLTLVFVFQLMDVSEKLWQVYNRLDPVSLNQVITEVAPPLLPLYEDSETVLIQ